MDDLVKVEHHQKLGGALRHLGTHSFAPLLVCFKSENAEVFGHN